MARSSEALERRAAKRSRTVEEQQNSDTLEGRKKHFKSTEKGREVTDGLAEPGAWKCPTCNNQNFASRYICNSKTCNESKPESAVKESQLHRANRFGGLGPSGRRPGSLGGKPPNPRKEKRHNSESSKVLDWSKPQASESQINENQRLRQRLKDEDPTLIGDDLERAKMLVARDERKQQKKKKSKDAPGGFKGGKNATTKEEPTSKTDAIVVVVDDAEKEKLSKAAKKERRKGEKLLLKQLEETEGKGMAETEKTKATELMARKADKSLLKVFEKTGGKGMSEEDVTQAEDMVARKERKRQKRTHGVNKEQHMSMVEEKQAQQQVSH